MRTFLAYCVVVLLLTVAYSAIASTSKYSKYDGNSVVTANSGLSVGVQPIKDVESSIRVIKELQGEPFIGVWGGKPFMLTVNGSDPTEFERAHVLIAISDGEVYDVTEGRSLIYSCDYLALYYVLVIASIEGREPLTCSLWIQPAWRKEDVKFIPVERPKIKKPLCEDEEIQEIIDSWWETKVLKLEETKGK
ncbi:hypothetical protein J7K50_05385 [bacterium]|nr:hypothetical protein [bacterium]